MWADVNELTRKADDEEWYNVELYAHQNRPVAPDETVIPNEETAL